MCPDACCSVFSSKRTLHVLANKLLPTTLVERSLQEHTSNFKPLRACSFLLMQRCMLPLLGCCSHCCSLSSLWCMFLYSSETVKLFKWCGYRRTTKIVADCARAIVCCDSLQFIIVQCQISIQQSTQFVICVIKT